MRKSIQNRIFTVFLTLLVIGIFITGILSITLTEVFVENLPTKISVIRYQLISVFIGLAVSLFLGIRYIRQAIDPIKQLTTITKKISRGDYFGQRIRSATGDELDELSENFNLMSIRLERTIRELEENSSRLETVLKSMTDGVIAIDNNEEIIIANPTVKEFFGVNKDRKVIGMNVIEAFRNPNLTDVISDISLHKKKKKSEIEIKSPLYRVLSVESGIMENPFDPNRAFGIVIMFHDITEIRKLENMRKSFVANVSHELKTPLTSIKGFVETLKSGNIEDEKTRERFLNIIEIESDRLSFLIEDLLVLSEIESKERVRKSEEIDVISVANMTIDLLQNTAKKKNISLNVHPNSDNIRLSGDRTRFQQMIMNLLDNGIKYTPDGGKVDLNIYDKNDIIKIVVKDTGIGIPSESINRLFERFYRVDKARSRQVGGTGLGLAIVKHIVISFGGDISVSSEEGFGSEFSIVIPKGGERLA